MCVSVLEIVVIDGAVAFIVVLTVFLLLFVYFLLL